ncbi:unnamed protein product [Brachionus calyciflorus]|uniref:Uncharacterized protein n=1 Tax=Brachionus calyciflorus TaxID=104777 RepID=A0A813MAC3_9BILA|nr:unnamed protein product [Brachionus calyciflorus]
MNTMPRGGFQQKFHPPIKQSYCIFATSANRELVTINDDDERSSLENKELKNLTQSRNKEGSIFLLTLEKGLTFSAQRTNDTVQHFFTRDMGKIYSFPIIREFRILDYLRISGIHQSDIGYYISYNILVSDIRISSDIDVLQYPKLLIMVIN